MKKYLLIGLLSTGFGLMAPPKDNTIWRPCTPEMKANSAYEIAMAYTKHDQTENFFKVGKTVYVINANEEYRELTEEEKKLPCQKYYNSR